MNWYFLAPLVLGAAVSTLVISLFVFVADPLCVFRVCQDGYDMSAGRRYVKPGLARNQSLDGIILGSSKSISLPVSEAGKLFPGNWLNLSIEGSTAYEQFLVARTALLSNPKLKYVMWELRTDAFIGEWNRTRLGINFPHHLYGRLDHTIFKYLLSFQSVAKGLNVLRNGGKKYFDGMVKPGVHTFDRNSVETTLRSFCLRKSNSHRTESEGIDNVEIVFQNTIEVLASEFPATKFYLFLAPSNILQHIANYEAFPDDFAITISMRHASSNLVKKNYENVIMRDFQTVRGMIGPWHRYRDFNHYDQSIQNAMLTKLAKDRQGSRSDEIRDETQKLIEWVKSGRWKDICQRDYSSLQNFL